MGKSRKSSKCPRCNSRNVIIQDSFDGGINLYICADCDLEFETGGYSTRSDDVDYDFDSFEDSWYEQEEI